MIRRLQTASGGSFAPLDPREEDVRIEDVAHHLAGMPRFNAATRVPYSVAQHSVMVSQIVDQKHALFGLFHDASEAYLIDLPRPVKHAPEFARYRAIEKLVQFTIYRRFGLDPAEEPRELKDVDRRMLRTEQRDLMPPCPEWDDRSDAEPYSFAIVPWSFLDSRRLFLERFEELTRGKR